MTRKATYLSIKEDILCGIFNIQDTDVKNVSLTGAVL
jgi:hypothetical protein